MGLGRDLAEVGKGAGGDLNWVVGVATGVPVVVGISVGVVERDGAAGLAGILGAIIVLLVWQCVRLVRKVRELTAQATDRRAEFATFAADREAGQAAAAEAAEREADRAAVVVARTEAPDRFRVMLHRSVMEAPPIRARLVALGPFSPHDEADPASEWSRAVTDARVWAHNVVFLIRAEEGSVSVWHRMVHRFGPTPDRVLLPDEMVPRAIGLIDWVTVLLDDYENA